MTRASTPPVLSEAEARTLSTVLDAIIPRSSDAQLPGAGELGLVAAIETAIRKSPDLAPAIVEGLAALDAAAASRGRPFAALPAEDRAEVLVRVADASPAFLPGLIFHTYTAYYQHPRVLEGLGIEGRPPHPKGYELEPGDLGLLERVRRRPRLYRE